MWILSHNPHFTFKNSYYFFVPCLTLELRLRYSFLLSSSCFSFKLISYSPFHSATTHYFILSIRIKVALLELDCTRKIRIPSYKNIVGLIVRRGRGFGSWLFFWGGFIKFRPQNQIILSWTDI